MNKYTWKEIDVPNWEPLSFAATCSYENKLFLAGGWNPVKNSFTSDFWSCDEKYHWEKRPIENSWSPRNGHTLTEYIGKFYLIGGFNYKSRYLKDVWLLDLENPNNEWNCVQDSSPWEGREGHTAIVFKNSLWIFGGITSSGLKNDIWSTQDGVNWRNDYETPPWSPRCFHNVVLFEEKLWLFAGSAEEGAKNDMFVSKNGADWRLVNKNLPFTPRFGTGVCMFDKKIWVLGGSDGKERDFTNEVWLFTEEDGWNQFIGGTPWTPRWGFNCVNEYNEKLVLLCGGVRYPDRKYSAFTDGWALEKTG